MKPKFRILKDWKITYSKSNRYFGQASVNTEKKRATIYPWEKKSKEPSDYKVHELLHCSIRALLKMRRNTKEIRIAEEELIQDICLIIRGEKS